MKKLYLLPVFIFFFQFVFGQISVLYENPDELFVCGQDTFFIEIENAGAALQNATVELNLPTGLSYVPNSANGANEQDISNLNQPILGLASLPSNQMVELFVLLTPDCDLVAAANMGQLFSIGVNVQAGAVQQNTQTASFKIETGLLVLLPPLPANLSGEKGDVLTRTVRIQNSRIGKVGALRFQDQHGAGISVATPSIGGAYVAQGLWEAEIDGAFISQFGNGDEWLDEDEILTFEEKITIEECDETAFDVGSVQRSIWGCNMALCQYDSLMTDVTVEPSTKNPDLVFSGDLQYHRDECGNVAAEQHFLVTNQGPDAANDVVLDFRQSVINFAFDAKSIEINTNGQGWVSKTANLTTPMDWECDVTDRDEAFVLVLDEVPANGYVDVRFNSFVCMEYCEPMAIFPQYDVFSFYLKPCPVNNPVSDSTRVGPTFIPRDTANVTYDFKVCIEEGMSQKLSMAVLAPLLNLDTGYLNLIVTLDKGLIWDDTCVPLLEGKAPDFIKTDLTATQNIYTLSYKMPIANALASIEFCVKFEDCDSLLECKNNFGMLEPIGGHIDVYQFDAMCENPCGQKGALVAVVGLDENVTEECGIASCDEFLIFVDATCLDDPSADSSLIAIPDNLNCTMDVYRKNIGFKDNDDNRIADDMSLADVTKIRRDRYITGDTIQVDLNCKVTSGQVIGFEPRVFYELIQSDQLLLGADGITVGGGIKAFTSFDKIDFLEASLTVYRQNGTTETCPIPPVFGEFEHSISIVQANTKPMSTVDNMASMWYQMDVQSSNCPSGAAFEEGDSLVLNSTYKLCTQFLNNGVDNPPVANFRTTMPRKKDLYAYKYHPLTALQQYAAYNDTLEFPQHTIRICEPSQTVKPLRYIKRLARDNFFPFEVRPIRKMRTFTYGIPDGVQLTSVTSDVRRLPSILLLGNEPSTWTVTGPNELQIDLSNLFDIKIDESFESITTFNWASSCDFPQPDTATYDLEITDDCNISAYEIRNRLNPLGFFSGSPDLVLTTADTILELSSPNINLDLLLRNVRTVNAPHAFIHAVPLNGSLTNQQFFIQNNATPLPQNGGVSEIGQINLLGQQNLNFQAQALNCGPLFIDLIYGYNCSTFSNPSGEACEQDTLKIEVRLLNTELELNILTQPASVPLCEPSEDFSFEIKNAKFGRAFDIAPLVKLPPGLSILPNSCSISYPIGQAPVPIPDPNTSGNGSFIWDFATILPQVTDGLPGVDEAPSNSFRIAFKVQADCGFVSNEQAIFGADGLQPCGAATNSIRKAGAPLLLEGFTAPPAVNVSLQGPTTVLTCGDESTWTVNVQITEGMSSALDSVYVAFPSGFSFVNGSYTAIANAPNAPSQTSASGLNLPLGAGLTVGQQMSFSIKLRYDEPAGCTDNILIASVRQLLTAFCTSINMDCPVYQSSGQAIATIFTANPDLNVYFTGTLNAAGTGANLTFETLGTTPLPAGTVIRYYKDTDASGTLSATDVLLDSSITNFAITDTETIVYNFNGDLGNLCGLIIEIPATNACACDDMVFVLNANVNIENPQIALCGLQTVDLGPQNANMTHTFSWSGPTGLSCTACSMTQFTPDPNTPLGSVFNFSLEETGQNCQFNHQYEVTFLDQPFITTPDQTICQGETVFLQANISQGTFNWTGPGISATGNATQTVSPTEDAVYTLTASVNPDCAGVDMVNITVLRSDSMAIAPIFTCENTPVDVQGTLTSTAGVYCQMLTNQFGCDSLICQELIVLLNTSENIPVCAGDSVEVFGQFYTAPNQACMTFTSSLGCDSTHCVELTIAQPPVLTEPDTLVVELGVGIQLVGPAGYTSYFWSPVENLSCVDCQTPTATFSKTGVYSYDLIVENAAGCADTVQYRIRVLPPCDIENPGIPNAFTPDGDGTNDSFKPLFGLEGLEIVLSMEIYNRWGEKIYANITQDAAWDGRQNGKLAPADTYIYIMELGCPDGRRAPKTGDVTLIR